MLILVDVYVRRPGILSADGRYTYWNLAAFCSQAYGNETIKGATTACRERE